MAEPADQMMARALRLLLAPYSRVTDKILENAYREQRTPAGLGKASPGEVLYARLALRTYEASLKRAVP